MIKQIFIIIIEVMKSIWNATTKVVWGITGIFLLALLLENLNTNVSSMASLLEISIFLMNYWYVFWLVFLASGLYYGLKYELNK